ncbi:MAG: hypothetical protein GY873_13105 [Bosea sp.]|uniref:hypothetical protein n=1 Tax=Bosea sp. (in: a-proteobacteria) TaxID=1871050 RepID=UPI00239AA105|nr:hypothetical protein [Bosea sp. (in: a-proteobacteria)]MCP4735121.1 hypothetical protein [Bosea sp. (in: a-proteobacteria)]
MKLDLIVGDERWRIACDTARAPRTLAAIAATLPTALQLHTPKIAGQHIYWHAPFVEDAEGGVDVMEAQPGAFLYWPARQFLELIFAPLQAETAEVTLLGQIEGGLPELQALGLRLREQHGRRLFAGNLVPIEGAQAPEPPPSQVSDELVAIRQKLWTTSPADIEALLASRATMHPAGPLFLAESEARILHELLWWVRGSLATEEPRISRRIAAVACNKAATRLRDFCHLGESAEAIFALEAAFGRDDIPLAALVDEAILCAGRLAAWLDLRIPWSAVNEATRSALDEATA